MAADFDGSTLSVPEPGPDEERPAFSPGSSPGTRYLFGDELARGGMGVVYEGQDLLLRRRVALKVLLEDRPQARARFETEARVAARLSHPGVAPVHELGTTPDGRLFLSMKLVEGRSLAEVVNSLRQGGAGGVSRAEYSLRRRLQIVIQVCEAVAYAHEQGVIHRDLKPSNIMVGAFGEVLVMDWGLAKVGPAFDAASCETDVGAPAAEASAKTSVGTVLGTPAFMAPEQAADSASVDERADVYGLGGVLYTLLTLRLPREGTTDDVLQALRSGAAVGPVTAHAGDPAVPAALRAVVARAVQLDPRARYPSASALREDLLAYTEQLPVSVYREPLWSRVGLWASRNRVLATALGVSLILGAATTSGVSWWRAQVQDERRARAEEIAALRGEELDRSRELSRLQAEQLAAAQRRQDALTPYLLGQDLLSRRAALDEAHALLTRAVQTDPSLGEAQATLARVCVFLDRTEEAKTHYLAALELQPENASWLVALGTLLLERQVTELGSDSAPAEEALPLFERAAKLDVATTPFARIGEGHVLVARNQLGEAVRVAEQAVKATPHLWEGWFLLGSAESRLAGQVAGADEHAERAAQAFRQGLELEREHPLLVRGLAEAYKQAGEIDEALAAYGRILERNPRDITTRLVRGMTLAGQKRTQEGLADIEQAVARAPDRPEVWVGRALLRADLGRPEEALSDLAHSLELKPHQLLARLARSRLREQLGELEGARADLEQAGADFAQQPRVWFLRGAFLSRRGELDAARESVRRGLGLDPALEVGWLALVEIEARAHDDQAAQAVLEESLAHCPDSRQLQRLQARLLEHTRRSE